MEIGEHIVVGRLGQQPLHIADTSVSPQHATLRRVSQDSYQIEAMQADKGIFVFGIRVKRKSLKANTPFFLGTYKTSVEELLRDPREIDLDAVWKAYEEEKKRWDRYSVMVNSIRTLSPILTIVAAQIVGQSWVVSLAVTVVVMVVAIVAGEKVLAKKNLRMAEMASDLKQTYLCPHCHKYLGATPYRVLKNNIYCPSCGVPLP